MERGRRNRRGRGHSHANRTHTACTPSPPRPKPWSFLSGLYSFFIMTSLIALIYLMLEYHCNNCNYKCDINNITKSIDDIAVNVTLYTLMMFYYLVWVVWEMYPATNWTSEPDNNNSYLINVEELTPAFSLSMLK